jgi:hypothetical protein
MNMSHISMCIPFECLQVVILCQRTIIIQSLRGFDTVKLLSQSKYCNQFQSCYNFLITDDHKFCLMARIVTSKDFCSVLLLAVTFFPFCMPRSWFHKGTEFNSLLDNVLTSVVKHI